MADAYERAEGASGETTLVPRWRANENVVPFSADVERLRGELATLPAGAVCLALGKIAHGNRIRHLDIVNDGGCWLLETMLAATWNIDVASTLLLCT